MLMKVLNIGKHKLSTYRHISNLIDNTEYLGQISVPSSTNSIIIPLEHCKMRRLHVLV